MVDKEKKLNKNEKRRLRHKLEKQQQQQESNTSSGGSSNSIAVDNDDSITVEYIEPNIEKDLFNNSNLEADSLSEFKLIFEKFLSSDNKQQQQPSSDAANDTTNNIANLKEEDSDAITSAGGKMSRRKTKLLGRLSVAQLKQLVAKSDIVEAHDVTASDPRFLVYLKAYRNSVPVPRHWCHTRKYLAGKRGVEKPPFKLPDFIAETGISKIRDSILELEALKKSKTKARDKLMPKMGKIDIDYQVLHDAFFKFQTKPRLTNHGDLYYEGKEFEVSANKDRKPGILSSELQAALGMSGVNIPPPWLINMQRYGPPPSYQSMRIPGLNAPLPNGASYGFHQGGWGKPPVDEYGRPIYGDVFGTAAGIEDNNDYDRLVDKEYKWGGITVFENEDDEEEDEEEDAEEDNDYGDSNNGQSYEDNDDVLDGTKSVITSGIETPLDVIDLRKREEAILSSKDLFTIIPETAVSTTGSGQFFASDRVYNLSATSTTADADMLAKGMTSGTASEVADAGKRKRRVEGDAVTKKIKNFKF